MYIEILWLKRRNYWRIGTKKAFFRQEQKKITRHHDE